MDTSSIFLFFIYLISWEIYQYLNRETAGGETSDSAEQQNEEFQIKLIKEEDVEAEDEDFLCKKAGFYLYPGM